MIEQTMKNQSKKKQRGGKENKKKCDGCMPYTKHNHHKCFDQKGNNSVESCRWSLHLRTTRHYDKIGNTIQGVEDNGSLSYLASLKSIQTVLKGVIYQEYR